jgi:hypothetical protein
MAAMSACVPWRMQLEFAPARTTRHRRRVRVLAFDDPSLLVDRQHD